MPVLRLTAPRRAGVPCPKKITLWDRVLTWERRFGGGRRVDGLRAVFLLVACCYQEGAGPALKDPAYPMNSRFDENLGTPRLTIQRYSPSKRRTLNSVAYSEQRA